MILWAQKKLRTYSFATFNIVTNLPLIILISYLVMPYKPWLLPISLSTTIVLVGVFNLLKNWRTTFSEPLPKVETILFLLMITLFAFSAIGINYSHLSITGLVAYFSSFLTFVVIRLTISKINLNFIYYTFIAYLMATGLLIFSEMMFGQHFFISNFFMTDWIFVKEYRFGSGFAPYSSLAGGLILWPLSVLITKYAISIKTNSSIKISKALLLCAITLGIAALFYTLARASWVGLISGMIFLFFSLIYSRMKPVKLIKVFFVALGIFIIAAFIIPRQVYYNNAIGERIEMTTASISQIFKIIYPKKIESVNNKLPQSTTNEIPAASISTIDASANTRVRLYNFAVYVIEKHPFWGIGIDHFPLVYEEYYKPLHSKAPENIDPTTKLDAHNFILTYIVESGIIASIPFFAFILYLIGQGILRGPKHDSFPFLIGLISICTWMIFTGFIKERLFWLALATLSGLISNKIAENKSLENQVSIKRLCWQKK